MYIYTTVGIVLLIWIGALVGYLSKGYFRPHQAPPSPVASSRRITFEQVFTSLKGLTGRSRTANSMPVINRSNGRRRNQDTTVYFSYGMSYSMKTGLTEGRMERSYVRM